MSGEQGSQKSAAGNRNRNAAILCVAVVGGMVGMAYAAVPLYQLFCQVTGYGGTTQRVEQYSDTILDQTITVRFDANTNGVPWEFQPKQREVTLRLGETKQISYVSRNLSNVPTSGTATFNVSPARAGAYFNKVECFCFTEQELQPGQSYDMPVVFFVDPEIVNVPELKNLKTITLSYTFFPLEKKAPVAAAPKTNTNQNENLGG
ncbi:cytochrome c oxidase assembly protein [Nitratireductor rhodophyticola]|uniref:Cytochrome c oxidase assembly protein CtaG n=1 Tax=Nitratireductor rhodophyticola TaxID=2854036 RepID=A0ABS7RER6_9HYPH|nr:cytochrome c oxidase assembly protein [Nitratireductor rhodophyticola]MBY8918173.1 cytochrome c oxidase assembly protein [Nitratireductor rhodophyticola]MBY8921018.1 cytochrome c oxidase assembly protein [Nitratireductor rhodophyticola]MEC9247099.1 cytochrome c oxidase assembly protein [Pseudomonadota bacterium]WPZ14244.1 cytochrome c oxidase assembly protein [Nitratireductor rhodophyticola]